MKLALELVFNTVFLLFYHTLFNSWNLVILPLDIKLFIVAIVKKNPFVSYKKLEAKVNNSNPIRKGKFGKGFSKP